MIKFWYLCLIVLVLYIPFYAFSSTDFATKIMQLRDEVGALSDDFKTEKELLKAKIQTLALEKMDLDSKLRRQNLQLNAINDKIAKAKNLKDLKNPEFDKIIAQFMDFETARLKKSLPFKRTERLQSLEQIKNDFLQTKNTPEKTLQLLWSHVEDEIQLAKDISIDKDVIDLAGQPTLVEVAKVGMLMMFYKLSNGELGYIHLSPEGWTPKILPNSQSSLLIESFFSSLKKQIRTGYFEFPKIPIKSSTPNPKQNVKRGEKNDQA